MSRDTKRARARRDAPAAVPPPEPTFGAAELLSTTFRLTWSSLGALLALVAVTQGPWLVLEALGALESLTEDDRPRVEGVYQIVLGVLMTGAIVRLVHGRLVGERRSVWECLRSALRHYWSLLGTMLMATLWSLVYALLLVVPGVMKWLSYSVAVPVVMIEDRRASEALARSSQLMFGHRRAALWSWLVVLLLSSPPALAGLLLPRVESDAARAALSLAEALLALPVDVLAVVMFARVEDAHRRFRREVMSDH